jgi:hypothetical protein
MRSTKKLFLIELPPDDLIYVSQTTDPQARKICLLSGRDTAGEHVDFPACVVDGYLDCCRLVYTCTGALVKVVHDHLLTTRPNTMSLVFAFNIPVPSGTNISSCM